MSCCHCNTNNHTPDDEELSQGAKLIVSAISLICGFLVQHFDIQVPAYPISDPSWIAVWICAMPIFKNAFFAIFKLKKITVQVLLASAMLGAFALQILALLGYVSEHHSEASYIFVVGEIAFLMALGEWIEDKTVVKAQSAIVSLGRIIPKRALKKIGDNYEDVCISTIEIDDIIAIKPNEIIPVDAKVIKGETSVDESTITGESMPCDKKISDKVFAGTLNKSGYIEVCVLKRVSDSTISLLAKAVEEAKGTKAPISRIADKWASKIVPIAISTAIFVFLGAKYLLGVDTLDALIRAITILIVFCPCAFVLATPTAISASLGKLAKSGILVKNGATVENLSYVDKVFFDKTGTLTHAKISVSKIFPKFVSEDELLSIVASAEKFSEHPIAKAILEYAKNKVEIKTPENVQSHIGVGVSCKLGDDYISVEKFQDISDIPDLIDAQKRGETIVKVNRNDEIIGYIALSDTIRDSAKLAINHLKNLGCHCEMLTGDSKQSAENVAQQVGISDFKAQLLPQDKLDFLKSAKLDDNKKICMVGDGVNDAPALAQADVSIAMSDLKSDLAINISDILLVGSDLQKIPQAISFSQRTMRIIKTNMTLSVLINASAIILAFAGILTPVIGAIWHNASSIIVVLNSARLLNAKLK
ncbi:MAG: cation-translocating P-type ATPase [Opitutales bacterium]|nr:cation-translocating P-type ATPase [Opitutales bacterium]